MRCSTAVDAPESLTSRRAPRTGGGRRLLRLSPAFTATLNLPRLTRRVLHRMQPPVARICTPTRAHNAPPIGQQLATLLALGPLRWPQPAALRSRLLQNLLTVLLVVGARPRTLHLSCRRVTPPIAPPVTTLRRAERSTRMDAVMQRSTTLGAAHPPPRLQQRIPRNSVVYPGEGNNDCGVGRRVACGVDAPPSHAASPSAVTSSSETGWCC